MPPKRKATAKTTPTAKTASPAGAAVDDSGATVAVPNVRHDAAGDGDDVAAGGNPTPSKKARTSTASKTSTTKPKSKKSSSKTNPPLARPPLAQTASTTPQPNTSFTSHRIDDPPTPASTREKSGVLVPQPASPLEALAATADEPRTQRVTVGTATHRSIVFSGSALLVTGLAWA